jgi:hypothetical protein
MAFDAGVAQGGVFIAPKRKHRLVHLLGVEHLEPHQQVKVLHRQPGHCDEQTGLQFGDDVLQSVFTKVGQVREPLITTVFSPSLAETSAAEKGLQPWQIREQTGHKSDVTLAKYIRPVARRKILSLL